MADWNLFRGNAQQTGCSTDQGPARGEIAFRTPLGRQWYAPPLVEGERAYQVCPGRKGRRILCVDVGSGETVWETHGEREPGPDDLPAKLRLSSRIVDGDRSLFVRALNDDGIYEIAKSDGRVLRAIRGNGILDYRTHPAPILAGNARYLVYPVGTQSTAGASAARTGDRIWRHVACRDTESGALMWTYNVGQFFGEPAVTDDSVYVGTSEGYVYRLAITIAESDSSRIGTASPRRIRWQRKLDAPVNASPAVSGGRLYFGANDGVVYCVNAEDGSKVWTYRAGRPKEAAFIFFSKPEVSGGEVLIGDAHGIVHVLSADSGDLIRAFEAPDWVRAKPARSDDGLLVASLDGTVALYDYSGAEVWRRRLNRWHLTCDPVVAGEVALVVTSDMTLWCLSLSDGSIRWRISLVDYPVDWVAFDEFQSSPQVSGQRVFVGTPGHFLYAVDKDSGEPLWRFETGGEIPCDPICVEESVFFGQQGGEGSFFSLDASTGAVRWKQDLGRVWAAPTYCDGLLYVAGAGGVAYCLEAHSGRIIWRYPIASDLYAAPPVDGDLVYFGSWDHWLYALNRHTGALAWRFDAETYLDSGAPVVKDGRLYLPTMGPRFYCLSARTGEIIWSFVPQTVWTTNASPAVSGDRIVITVFASGGRPYSTYDIWTYCLNATNGDVIWKYHAGGLNGPTIAGNRVYFGSTSRKDRNFYCLDLAGNGDGTTDALFAVPLEFNVLESCTAISGTRAYVYAEDGYLYGID